MCGISGVINKSGKPVDQEMLEQMNDSIKHSGPEGEGKFFDKNIGLGHRRLAILDLSEDGAQPMKRNDNIIVINGKI